MAVRAPPVIAGLVRGDAQQPGAKRGTAAKRLDGAKGSNKGLLRHIGGHVPVAQHAQGEGIYRLLVAQHELIERADIPALAACYKL